MASKAAYDELDRVRKALKHARIKRDRVPKADHEAKGRAEEKVAALEKRRDELYAQHGRRTASKLEDAQTEHASAADQARRGLAMVQTALSRMQGANRDTVAAAMEQIHGAAAEKKPCAASQEVKTHFVKEGYAIVICSAGRPKDLAKTLQVLLANDAEDEIRTRIYVQVFPFDPKIAEYEEVTNMKKVSLVPGVPGLPGQREQAWLNHSFSHTLFVDDDLVRIVWPFGNVHHLASTLRQAMLNADCRLGGVSASQRPKPDMGLQPQLSEKPGLVSGYFYMQSREDRIGLPLSDACNGIGEDVERTVRYYAHSGIIRLMNCAVTAKNALSVGGKQQAGGISTHVERGVRSENQIALVRALVEQHPGILKPAPERPNRCEFIRNEAGQKRPRSGEGDTVHLSKQPRRR